MVRRALTVFVVTVSVLLAASQAAGQERRRRSAPPPEKQQSNASMRTQQRTGDAMSEKMGRSAAPAAKSQGKAEPAKTESAEDLRAELDDVERRLDAEKERLAEALAGLRAAEQAAVKSGKAKSVASARKAIDRETSAHERKTAPLLEKRDELRRKLDRMPAGAARASD